MLRCTEPGWIELARPDGRRGVWMRVTEDTIELCGGREGDDVHLVLRRGEPISERDLADAREVVERYVWAKELAAEAQAEKRNAPG